MDMNMLQKYMDFADQQHLFDMYKPTGGGFQSTVFNVPKMKADWAMQMMGPQGGDRADVSGFFGGGSTPGANYSPAPYVQPQRFDAPMPSRSAPQSPMTDQVNNYLARLLGRR